MCFLRGAYEKNTLKTLAIAIALFALVGCGKSEFADNRDGKVYATTTIGKQVWMAENLDYAIDGSWCYQDNPANCEKYGRLYTWNAAMKACPAGWHLPTNEEWDELGETLGEGAGKKLKTTSWGGTNEAGFFALPAGDRFYYGDFSSMGSDACFWTATEYEDYYAYRRYLKSDGTRLHSCDYNKGLACSVRCLQD